MIGFKIPRGIECPDWEPLPQNLDVSGNSKSKRCRYYIAPDAVSNRGLCELQTHFSCSEWDRANPGLVVRPPVQAQGSIPPAIPPPSAGKASQASLPVYMGAPGASDEPKASRAKPAGSGPRELPYNSLPDPGPDVLVSIRPEQIVALKAAGLEVQVKSDAPMIGEFWLVPEKTGKDRMELSFDECATIRMIADVFPGARVIGLRKSDVEMDDEGT